MAQVESLDKITSTFEGSSTDSYHGTFGGAPLDLNGSQVKDSAGGTAQVGRRFQNKSMATVTIAGSLHPHLAFHGITTELFAFIGNRKINDRVAFILQNTPFTLSLIFYQSFS